MIALNDVFRQKARDRKLPEEAIAELWEQHVEFCARSGIACGGRPWEKFLDSVVERMKTTQALSDSERQLEADRAIARKLEREAKDIIDREYEKNAVSLQDWLGDLRTRDDFGEAITPLEAHVARYRDPLPGEDAAAWLMAAVKDAPKLGRNRTCACGRPVATWVRRDHRYYASDCLECWQKARAER